ncbi:LysR substrate-binding domain-containing protein [Rhodobium gokarnense]|uniref:LysR family glycine cleavage system transcriptional activator n=1 Tax=Rhodobium gokarnense TaxID=364296 RepID=A0ABT3HBA7_9HYPH|nr:LysR substrate-binding domain-containing protein [Rhodobium gokarnense]MCW2307665.1 LysR family glycine cleavage system transcriptional activator [Rhodobium gokarnense]
MKALQAFEAAARHESVTMAAAELNVSHSAVSQQIKALEHYFNQKLFKKKGNGLELLPKARNYLQDIKQSLDLIAVASENLSSSSAIKRVRVNATPTFATQWLIPRIAEFQRVYPTIEVRMETSMTDDLPNEAENNDLIIRRYPMKQSGMVCVRLLEDETIAVASPKLLRDHRPSQASDLLNYDLLHIRSRISAWPTWFRKAGIESSHTLQGQVFDHIFLAIAAAKNGAGICLTPRAFVEQELAEDRLVNLCPDIAVVGSGFFGLYDKQNRSLRNIEGLINWLIQRVPNGTPDGMDVAW